MPRSRRVTRWWRRACRDRPSPATCSWSTRPITLDCVAWSRARSRFDVSKRCGRTSSTSSTISSTASPAQGPDSQVDLVAAVRVPAAVHRDLRAARRPRRRARRRWGVGSPRCSAPTSTPEEYAAAKQASDSVVAQLTSLVRDEVRGSGRRSHQRVDRGPRRRRAPEPAGAALDDLPADRRRARHHRQPHREQRRRAAPPSRPTRRACAPTPTTISAAVEELLRYDAPVPHATFRYALETDRPRRRRRSPPARRSSSTSASANRDAGAVSRARHPRPRPG